MDAEIFGPETARLLDRQAGVVARAQLLAAGAQPHDLARMVRRRELARVHPGVFVDHAGRPTWLQRAWAACLYHWPAALAGPSALRAVLGPGWRHHDDAGPVHVAVAAERCCVPADGVRPHRMAALEDVAIWDAAPPRVRIEDAALAVATTRADRVAQVALLADVCQSGWTTADRVLEALAFRSRVRDRTWLAQMLTDVADGTCSTLEHGYLTRVERAHGLPASTRQRRGASELGPVRRDVDYEPLPLIVELDGRLFHDSAGQRDRDLDRDLDLVVAGRRAVRLGWGQVYGRPCRTAARVGEVLGQLGWSGRPRRCGPHCALEARSRIST